jgi:hypothetical protein
VSRVSQEADEREECLSAKSFTASGTPTSGRSMKAIVQDTYGKADVLELRDIDKPVQDTYGSADVQTATGGTR